MKSKLLIASALIALGCGSIFAQNTLQKPADQVRIYINPGHGSWGPNNRPMQTIGRDEYNAADVDTTGFFESNTNLLKGYSLLDRLVEAGVPFDRTKNQTGDNPARIGAALDLSQNIVMSHVKAGPYPYTGEADDEENAYNRPLSEIREEVEANDFDIFISIHSNANVDGDGVNYPLFLYRGYDDERESVPGSRELAEHMWPYTFSDAHKCWSYYSATSMNVRGDVNFYGESNSGYTENNGKRYFGYLGVLKHGVPGFLVEGYFHTYQPARQRAMNDDVCYHEGHLYARGLVDYMGWQKETTGEIYGIVRDMHEKFSDPLYHAIARTDDVYKPLNGVKVTLMKDGEVVDTYTTDNEYNGAFLFTYLEPGEYTLSYEAKGYKEAFEEYLQPVTVTANETTYINPMLEAEGYEPPAIVYVNYPDAVEGNKAFSVAGEYNVEQEVTEANPLEEQLAGKTVRRQIVRNGNMYVLALDADNEPYIYMVNLSDNTVTNISTNGTTLDDNRDLKISDIALSADNVLLASSYGENQFDASQVAAGDVRGSVAIYKWENNENGVPTGDPAVMFTSQNSGNYFNAMTGKTLAYSGTIEDGTAMITAQTTGSSTSLRFVEFAIADGELVATTFINNVVTAESNYTATKIGDDMQLVVSPNADNQYVIDGSNTNPMEWQTAGQNVDAPLLGRISEELMTPEENGATFFRYAGRSLMVMPVKEEGKVTGIKMFDITDGLDNAKEIALNGAEIEATEATYSTAAANVVTTLDDNEQVSDAQMEFYLILDGKVSKFTTAEVEQPVIRGNYAYALNVEVGDTETTFTFKSSGDADNGSIVVTNANNKETSFPTGAIYEGDNEVTIANDDMPEGELSWRIEVYGKAIGAATKLYGESLGSVRGVAVDNNPSSAYLGMVYVGNSKSADKAQGVWKYDQTLAPVNTEAIGNDEFSQGNASSPYRMSMAPDGTVIASDWSDPHSGIYTINPETDEVKNLYAGDRASNGSFTYNGVEIGGSTTGAAVAGTGENRRIFAYTEESPVNKLVRYDIGTNTVIDKAPDMIYETVSAKLANLDVNVIATENGFWAGQNRSAGQNTEGVPALLYADNDGNILYNSGTSNNLDLNGCDGGGFAINCDNNMLAIVNELQGVNVYELTWNENTPALSFLYSFAVGDGRIRSMAFDRANNLYLAAENEFQVWSLPTAENKGVTPATTTFMAKLSSVEENVAESNKVVVYPNPATDVVNVETSEPITAIAVYNMNGAAVNAEYSVNGNNATINVRGLASGIYFVRINNGEAVRVIKR